MASEASASRWLQKSLRVQIAALSVLTAGRPLSLAFWPGAPSSALRFGLLADFCRKLLVGPGSPAGLATGLGSFPGQAGLSQGICLTSPRPCRPPQA